MRRLTKEEEQLVTDNINLAYSITNKYASKLSNFIDYEEILSICFEALVKAATYYKPNRNIKFSTYAYNAMKHDLFNEYNRLLNKSNNYNIISLDVPQTEDNETLSSVIPNDLDLEKLIILEGDVEKLYIYIESLPSDLKLIMQLRLQDKNFKEIAAIFNKHESSVYKQYKKGLNMLRTKFKGENNE